MSNKRQIVGPVLKPEAPASREGVWEWHNLSIVRRNSAGRVYAALTVPDAVATLNALEADLVREREAHAATGLSEPLYQESLAQAQGELRTVEATLADLQGKHDALVRILITDGHREDCCDLVNDWCDAWLAANPAPQTEAPAE